MADPARKLRALPRMHPVESSAVAAIGYDERAQELFVRFVGSRLYAYAGVDRETYEALRRAGSVGTFVNREIKPCFPATSL